MEAVSKEKIYELLSRGGHIISCNTMKTGNKKINLYQQVGKEGQDGKKLNVLKETRAFSRVYFLILEPRIPLIILKFSRKHFFSIGF